MTYALLTGFKPGQLEAWYAERIKEDEAIRDAEHAELRRFQMLDSETRFFTMRKADACRRIYRILKREFPWADSETLDTCYESACNSHLVVGGFSWVQPVVFARVLFAARAALPSEYTCCFCGTLWRNWDTQNTDKRKKFFSSVGATRSEWRVAVGQYLTTACANCLIKRQKEIICLKRAALKLKEVRQKIRVLRQSIKLDHCV